MDEYHTLHHWQEQMPAARKMLIELMPQALAGGYLRLFLDEGKGMVVLLRSLIPHLQEKPLWHISRPSCVPFRASRNIYLHLVLHLLSSRSLHRSNASCVC